MKTALEKLEEENEEVKISELCEIAEECFNIDPEKTEDILDSCKGEGEMFEPESGHIQTI